MQPHSQGFTHSFRFLHKFEFTYSILENCVKQSCSPSHFSIRRENLVRKCEPDIEIEVFNPQARDSPAKACELAGMVTVKVTFGSLD